MATIGATVAIIEGDTILLTLREDFEVWCMPGGSVEVGESIADAARREVREETGLEVELTRLVGIYSRIGWHDHHASLFAARIIGGSLSPEPGEVLEARFFPLDALPEHMLISQASRIADVISGAAGIVKSERVIAPANIPPQSRAEIYALRDQSGLSRREFYLSNIPLIAPEQVKIEIPGIQP